MISVSDQIALFNQKKLFKKKNKLGGGFNIFLFIFLPYLG